jgi:hypothetical protein
VCTHRRLDPLDPHGPCKHWAASEPARFEYTIGPLDPENWTERDQPVNRDRLFQYYTKQAEHFRQQDFPPPLLEEFPGLDGHGHGHWGNQNESGWKDARWNEVKLGSVQCGVFRGGGVQVRRGVCLQLGEDRELFACFDPETLAYVAVWKGQFLRFSDVRHGFMDGLQMAGELIPGVSTAPVTGAFEYHGFYRNGERVVALLPDGESTLKTYFREKDGTIRLQPANPDFEPIIVRDCRIQGVVIGVLRRY